MSHNPFAPPSFHGSTSAVAPARSFPVARPALVAAPAPKPNAHPGKSGRQPSPTALRALILDVAKSLPQPFRTEDLVVACWRTYPERFCLQGHAEHPDSNKVLCKLPELHRRGLLRSVDARMYEVTRAGRAA